VCSSDLAGLLFIVFGLVVFARDVVDFFERNIFRPTPLGTIWYLIDSSTLSDAQALSVEESIRYQIVPSGVGRKMLRSKKSTTSRAKTTSPNTMNSRPAERMGDRRFDSRGKRVPDTAFTLPRPRAPEIAAAGTPATPPALTVATGRPDPHNRPL